MNEKIDNVSVYGVVSVYGLPVSTFENNSHTIDLDTAP